MACISRGLILPSRISVATHRPHLLHLTSSFLHSRFAHLPPQAFDPRGHSIGWPGRHLETSYRRLSGSLNHAAYSSVTHAKQRLSDKSVHSQHGSRQNGPRNTTPQAGSLKTKKNNYRPPKRSRQPEQPKQPQQTEQPRPVRPRAYLCAFFEKYPSFDYDSSKPVMAEFYRMCDRFGWEKDDEDREEARDNLKDAMVHEFNAIYGTDHESLAAWQSLCRVLNLTNVPGKLRTCRRRVKSMHVNIVDLVDTPVTQVPVTHFPSEAALSTYTIKSGKYFPKENAYAGGLLRYLLRHIDNPRKDRGRL
ncbi:unnamed protein product [Rhizoctonia solani]|uniref:Uncharacterized protein n=2 Tax=Rhizoctonia solani TaxID=456999 RepID=A0A8H2WWB4_9AGAM|nr:hypothetical protein V565_079570 [Rhizoctonia solani 123E]CAE6411267.1 unnamed protein product [Rhizoctonia solani]